MLDYLLQLSFEVLGQNVLVFLELVDIVRFENAAASHKSQQLLRAILPYCSYIAVTPNINFQFNCKSMNWFNTRRCRVKHAIVPVKVMYKVHVQHHIIDNIELRFSNNTSLRYIESLNNPYIHERVTSVTIKGNQDPAVIEVLFSLLSSVLSLNIEHSNLSAWKEYISNLGPCMYQLSIKGVNLFHGSYITDSNILQSIASNCPHICSISLVIDFVSSNIIDAEMTAFAEKCPQLEELSLHCRQLTDQSVIALAQHCSRLKKLKLDGCDLAATSLIALSERGLPLEELDIPEIPIPSAEIAAQCAHALSRIRELNLFRFDSSIDRYLNTIQYMTGLREIYTNNPDDYLLLPYLLQSSHYIYLEKITIRSCSSITPEQFMKLITQCKKLHTISIDNPTLYI